jgi:hypothetical protein
MNQWYTEAATCSVMGEVCKAWDLDHALANYDRFQTMISFRKIQQTMAFWTASAHVRFQEKSTSQEMFFHYHCVSAYKELNSPLDLHGCYLALPRRFDDSGWDCPNKSPVLSSLIICIFTFTKRDVQGWCTSPLSTEHCVESSSIYLELV